MNTEKVIEKIEMYEIAYCDLVHEKTNAEAGTAKNAIVRNSLCNKKIRNQRLGCAHSMSNTHFLSLLNEVVVDNEIHKVFKTEFDRIICSIYLLDHEKGEFEKAKVLACNQSSAMQVNIKTNLQRITHDHRELIKALENLKQAIINHIKGCKTNLQP